MLHPSPPPVRQLFSYVFHVILMIWRAPIRRILLILCAVGLVAILFSSKPSQTRSYWKNYANSWSYPSFVNTAHKGGYLSTNYGYGVRSGLGNQLFELLALVGIADKLKRIPYIKVDNEYMLKKLGDSIREHFPALQRQLSVVYWKVTEKVVPFNGYGCCIYDDVEKLKKEKDEYLQLDGLYFQSYKYFDHLRSNVRNWLLPNETIQQNVGKRLPEELKDNFVICVHIRRGDFVTIGWKGPSDVRFSVTALQFLIRKYTRNNKQVGAVILGNEIDWEKETFAGMPRVHVMENSTPIEDLAFSRLYCDAMLITAPSSTFGFFLGYLSKRFDVYYKDILTTKDRTQKEMYQADFFPPSWTKLLETDGRIKEISNDL